jgi:hypothetical protein
MKRTVIKFLLEEGGKVASDLLRLKMAAPKKPRINKETEEEPVVPNVQYNMTNEVSLPSHEETTAELKRRLAKELYKAELDLASGLLIANKPCDCLDNKHTLFLEATSEELIPQDPGNTVYQEIIQWIKENQHKVTVEAISACTYKTEYPQMAAKFKEFRKRVMGTAALSAMVGTNPTVTLDDAKKIAATAAKKEVERLWEKEVSHGLE